MSRVLVVLLFPALVLLRPKAEQHVKTNSYQNV